jgi:hypothetical protein
MPMPFFYDCPFSRHKLVLLSRGAPGEFEHLCFENHHLTVHSIEDSDKPVFFMIARRHGTDEESLVWLKDKKEFVDLKNQLKEKDFRSYLKAYLDAAQGHETQRFTIEKV